MMKIYLDNAASIRLNKEVYNAMVPYLLNQFGITLAHPEYGRDAKVVIAGNYSYYGDGLAEISTLLSNNAITPPPINIIGDLSIVTVAKAHQLLEVNLTQGKKLVMKVE